MRDSSVLDYKKNSGLTTSHVGACFFPDKRGSKTIKQITDNNLIEGQIELN
jgi:hypothetical protein